MLPVQNVVRACVPMRALTSAKQHVASALWQVANRCEPASGQPQNPPES